MFKKITKAFFVAVCICGMVFTSSAQEKSYKMYESIILIPDYSKLKVLGENMRKHNQKYHKDGVHKATVYTIATGPNFGKIVWEMGPTTFTHLDSRPADSGHNDDWRDNVLSYVKKMDTREYWKENEKLTVDHTDDGKTPNYLYLRYFEVNKNEGHNIDRLFEQVSATFKAMDGDNPWAMYDNLFRQGDIGRHIATVTQFDNWAEMDQDRNFQAMFKKTHGDSEWEVFLENMNDSFTNSWDEIWQYDAFMSGN